MSVIYHNVGRQTPRLSGWCDRVLLVNIHSLNTATNLPLHHHLLSLAPRLGCRLLKLTELALLSLELLPPRRNLLLDLLHIDLHVFLLNLLLGESLARRQQMLILLNQLPVLLTLSLLVATHAGLVEGALSPLPDLGYTAHGLEGGLDEIAVVSHGHVAALSEGEGRVDGHFLVVRATERLCPGELAGVALHLEVLVAF